MGAEAQTPTWTSRAQIPGLLLRRRDPGKVVSAPRPSFANGVRWAWGMEVNRLTPTCYLDGFVYVVALFLYCCQKPSFQPVNIAESDGRASRAGSSREPLGTEVAWEGCAESCLWVCFVWLAYCLAHRESEKKKQLVAKL